ncbi:sulfotransferase [Pseudomonadota bacterium]
MHPNRLFVTGMARSGTTLLDKLLNSHSDVEVLSQPFPLVFVEAKRRFLDSLGVGTYYVLNDDLISRSYSHESFTVFLNEVQFHSSDIDDLFKKMAAYSGQSTRPDHARLPLKAGLLENFIEVVNDCMEYFNTKAVAYVGMKEIMCEEFLPYLASRGYRCVLIIRDPRDVLASANYPGSEKYFGEKKPALFVLRSWRKSVEFAWQLRNEPDFHCLRYEDLVAQPYIELNKLTDFLAVSSFEPGSLDSGVRDRAGQLWQANSSKQSPGSLVSEKSVGSYRTALGADEIAYTETVCEYEMAWLGYLPDSATDPEKCLRSYEDYGINDLPDLPADFSRRTEHVAQELRRRLTFKDFYACR